MALSAVYERPEAAIHSRRRYLPRAESNPIGVRAVGPLINTSRISCAISQALQVPINVVTGLVSGYATTQELCEIREQRVGRLRGYSPTGLCRLDASRTFQDAHFGRRQTRFG